MLDRWLGQRVRDPNGRSAGRIEEVRVKREGGGWIVDAYVLGAAGLWERLHLGARLILGIKRRGAVARWDQIEMDATGRLQLTCDPEQLQRA
jgi:hypothetical protein